MRLFYYHKVVVFWLLATGVAFGELNPVDRIVQEIEGAGDVDYAAISPEQRVQIIEKLKTKLKIGSYPFYRFYLEEGLIALNDPETSLDIVKKYQTNAPGGAESSLRRKGNVAAIPYLASDLFLPESVRLYEEGDVIMGPTRWRSAEIMLACVRHSTELPPATRAWAHNSKASGRDAWVLMLPWWKHNKEALLAHRYQEATWLPSPDDPPDPDPAIPSSTLLNQWWHRNQSAILTGHFQDITILSDLDASRLLIWFAALLILPIPILIGVWYFLRARKKR